jgi:hypothetical protein
MRLAAVAGTAALGGAAAAAEPVGKPKVNREEVVASKAAAESCGPRELFAVVDLYGKLKRGLHVEAVNYLAQGTYEVIFKRDVRRGVYVATVGGDSCYGLPPPGMAGVMGRASNPRGVIVLTSNANAETVDMGFHLLVVCPEGYA